jgi:hypothetical protein
MKKMERSAVQLLLLDQKMQVIGRATYWLTAPRKTTSNTSGLLPRLGEGARYASHPPLGSFEQAPSVVRIIARFSKMDSQMMSLNVDSYDSFGAAVDASPVSLLPRLRY